MEDLVEDEVLAVLQYFVQDQHLQPPPPAEDQVSLSSSSSSSDLTAAGKQPTRQTTKASDAAGGAVSQRAHPYSNRQRQELEYLKTRVRALEAEHKRLEAVNAQEHVGGSLWRRVAQQQYVESQKSIHENARLKAELAAQIKLSKTLARILRKQHILPAPNPLTTIKRRRRMRASPEMLHRLVAQEFQHRRQHMLHEAPVSKIMTEHRSMDIRATARADGIDCLCMEMLEARRFPFDFASVGREIWNFLSSAANVEQTVGNMSRKVDHADDASYATTFMEFAVGDRTGVMDTAVAFGKFVEDDCFTFVWISHGDCQIKNSSSTEYQLMERGWTSIRPLPGSPGSSILRSQINFSPTLLLTPSDSALDSPSADLLNQQSGLLTELILGAYHKAAGHIYTIVENKLVAEQLKQKHGGNDP